MKYFALFYHVVDDFVARRTPYREVVHERLDAPGARRKVVGHDERLGHGSVSIARMITVRFQTSDQDETAR